VRTSRCSLLFRNLKSAIDNPFAALLPLVSSWPSAQPSPDSLQAHNRLWIAECGVRTSRCSLLFRNLKSAIDNPFAALLPLVSSWPSAQPSPDSLQAYERVRTGCFLTQQSQIRIQQFHRLFDSHCGFRAGLLHSFGHNFDPSPFSSSRPGDQTHV